jgi:enoyl-CoA hydratase/carnithine racemase
MSVTVAQQGPVRTVILHRPEVRNAVDLETAVALFEAFRAVEADDSVRAAVLWGQGGVFCAGADLKAVAQARKPPPAADDPRGPMGPTRLALSKPVIAAIEGYCVAGGLELALWCDLRVAGRGAVLGVFNRRFGVPLIDGGTIRLPRLIGQGRALELILTGRPVPAEEAHAMGLVNRVVADGTARQAAEALAAELAAFPQAALRGDRASVHAQWGLSLEAALRQEFALGRAALESGEARAGAQAFSAGEGRGGRF